MTAFCHLRLSPLALYAPLLHLLLFLIDGDGNADDERGGGGGGCPTIKAARCRWWWPCGRNRHGLGLGWRRKLARGFNCLFFLSLLRILASLWTRWTRATTSHLLLFLFVRPCVRSTQLVLLFVQCSASWMLINILVRRLLPPLCNSSTAAHYSFLFLYTCLFIHSFIHNSQFTWICSLIFDDDEAVRQDNAIR